MSKTWPFFVASRYLRSRRRNRSSAASVFAAIGIAVGVLTLTVVLAVMNGFQLGFIESILDISSYHIRLETPPSVGEDPSLETAVSALPGVAAILPFVELQTIARGVRRTQHGCLVRGVPGDAADRDPSLPRRLEFESGGFFLDTPDSMVLGAELARTLGVSVGDQLSILSLSGAALDSLSPEDGRFTVTGIFRSGFYEFDLGWAFVRLDAAERLYGGDAPVVYGVKLADRWADQRAVAAIEGLAMDGRALPEGTRVVSWREYNRSFFGALRTEKVMMIFLVALIFVVVGLSVFQSQRRVVLERQEELGLLRAIGASRLSVRLIFALDGLWVGLAGAVAGLVPGLAIAGDIGGFFSLLERAVNAALALLRSLESFFVPGSAGGGGQFSIFSPTVFYIKDIPSRVVPAEVALIFAFGVLSSALASWFASARASRVQPAEVLRYE